MSVHERIMKRTDQRKTVSGAQVDQTVGCLDAVRNGGEGGEVG